MSIETLAQSLIEATDQEVADSFTATGMAFESFANEYLAMSSRPVYGCKGCHGG